MSEPALVDLTLVPSSVLLFENRTRLIRLLKTFYRKDPDFAAEYLKAALEDEDEPRVLLTAFSHLAEGHRQGCQGCRHRTRESLPNGNPRLSTLVAVTKAIGLRPTFEPTP